MIRMSALFLVSAASVVCPAAPAAEPAKGKTVRLLTVGNSFSQNATRFLEPLTKAAGHTLVHRPLVVGGASMEVHLEKAKAFDADPTDVKGLYGKLSLKQALAADAWDVVTIQQASIKSHDPATYRPFARQLHDAIKAAAPRAEVVIHQTWAYRVDDPRFSKPSPAAGEPATRQAMYDALTRAYDGVAADLRLRVIPVGDAFQLADTDPTWGYKPDAGFDVKAAKSPALPVQTHSLHAGWRWTAGKDGKTTLAMDGHHANAAGQYLGACVFFEFLFGESPIGNTFVPKEIDGGYARFLQETAHRAIVNRQTRVPAR